MITVEELEKLLLQAPNTWIQDAFLKARQQLQFHDKIVCSISGGSDSDIMLDLLSKLDDEKKITYIWFDTGLEYEATKRHLKELEQKYDIKILPLKAKKPIPTSCKQYGQPFLSKRVSNYVERLQKHGFEWKDEPLDVLLKKYPKCKVALRWWCNDWGEKSRFNIEYNKWLKEFMIQNPPTFKISDKCCYHAKKAVGKDFANSGDYDLSCVGVRKSEGGARASAYKNCFTPTEVGKADNYRPLFWFDNESKEIYKNSFDVKYSDCYDIWGLKRTGCAACPFRRNFEEEIKCIEMYEPKLFKAVNKIFGDSYAYTRAYREFCSVQNAILNEKDSQT